LTLVLEFDADHLLGASGVLGSVRFAALEAASHADGDILGFDSASFIIFWNLGSLLSESKSGSNRSVAAVTLNECDFINFSR
jgi:hypothetical protein